jgi:hypothetical protein
MSDEFNQGLPIVLFSQFHVHSPPQSEILYNIYATAEGVFMRSSIKICTPELQSRLNVYFHVQILFRKHSDEVSTLRETSEEQINLLCN